jgi:hypothetical protein
VADLRHDGLIEALLDFGVDLAAPGFDVDLTVQPGINVGDISQNYKPALRCRAFTRINQIANPATFSGCALQAGITGFWLQAILSTVATSLNIGFSNNAAIVGNFTWATPVSWVAVGDSAGELRVGSLDGDFLAASLQGNNNPVGPVNGFLISTTGNREQIFPIWVPPMMTLVLSNIANNTACDFSIAVQIPSFAIGRLP